MEINGHVFEDKHVLKSSELKQPFLMWTFCSVVVLCHSLPERTVSSFHGALWTHVEQRVGELRNSSPWNTCRAPTPASAPSASAAPAPTPGRRGEPVLEVTTATAGTPGYTDLRKIKCPSQIWINRTS